MTTPPRSARTLLALAVLAAWATACGGPRYSRDIIHQSSGFEVTLRARTDVPPSYEHPVTISPVRLAHILASIDVRFDENEKKNARRGAVPVELIYPLGELIAKALAQADASQEVVVDARRKERKLKVFTTDLMTSVVVHMKGDLLYVHVARVDWPVPKNPNERIREADVRREHQAFKVLPSGGIVPAARQVVAVEWRRDSFRRADAVRIRSGGRVERRTILLEEPEEQAPKADPEDTLQIGDLSPEKLRALADLEEARRSGELGEAEYRSRRRKILAAE